MNIEKTKKEAINLIISGNKELGLSLLKKIELMYPSDDNLQYLLGFAYRQINQLKLSEKYLKKSIEINPNVETYHNALGITLQKQMRYDDAIISFKSAIQINPNSFHSFNSLGYTYKLKDKLENALDTYSKAASVLFNNIYDKIVNNSNFLIPYSSVEKLLGDNEWTERFTEILMYRAAEEGMKHINFPTEETTLKIDSEGSFNNKLFYDDNESRFILPNFFYNFAYELNINLDYSTLLNNIATVYNMQERDDKARKFYLESILFTPITEYYMPPIMALQNLTQQ